MNVPAQVCEGVENRFPHLTATNQEAYSLRLEKPVTISKHYQLIIPSLSSNFPNYSEGYSSWQNNILSRGRFVDSIDSITTTDSHVSEPAVTAALQRFAF